MDLEPLRSLFDRLGSYPIYVVLAELFLIGLVVNWCAGVLHGTRGTRLLRGLLVVLVAATLVVRVLAGQLHWERLALLYQYFIIGMGFVALVAFQPELRRALIRAGDVRFRRRRTPRDRLISALTESAAYLSRNRFGAIVAIQRDVGLANWAENGTQLNAEVSATLLNTLFYPNSPLHDLGVIIRGTRVLAAGCQFPVAESGEVDVSLGSRHRAAVGLSAESDALVLVVSEETGTISLAEGGNLARFLALDDLQEALESRLTGDSLTSPRRRKRSLSDLWRVLRRLLVVIPLTCVIWFLADQANLISAEGIKAELVVTHDNTVEIDVPRPPPPVFALDLRGSRRAVDSLAAVMEERPLRIEWPLPAIYARSGRQTLDEAQLREIFNSAPELRARGLFVEAVSPARFVFIVHQVTSVDVPVRVDSGALRVNVERIEPERTRVWLRQSDLEQLSPSEMYIEADLRERLAGEPRNRPLDFTGVPLRLRIDGVPADHADPPSVNLTVSIVAENITKRLTGIQVRVAASPQIWQRYTIEYQDANEWLLDIEVEGDEVAVNRLRPQDVTATVPLTSETAVPSKEFRLMDVVIKLPEGVSLVGPSRQVRMRLVPREGAAP